ncbi:MAG: LuxR C-terminal-related transcriptional regulator [Gemmatimonadales bacterium]|nr:LuxR C-terminal-related transcriptional regulator [Gemmatimonadales bacterium]
MTWHPEDPSLVDWIYINDSLCRLVGRSKAEFLEKTPYQQISREARAQIEGFNAQLVTHGQVTAESVVLHTSHEPIPVMMYMKLIKGDDGPLLLTEFHDIRSFKEVEARLSQAKDRTRNIMTLIGREKQQISDNIQGNLGLVALPLIDQLRTTATTVQKEILTALENRIKHISRKMGVSIESGLPGSNLTRRQILVCEMIRDGMASKEIATALGCSVSTVNNHRNTIRKKLGLSRKSANLQAFLNSMPGDQEGPV